MNLPMRGFPHPNTELQEHYDQAVRIGHDETCRRRIVPTISSDHRAFDPERCERCDMLTSTSPFARIASR